MPQCDWREKRQLVMSQARRVVIKVGSAVLAGQHGIDATVIAGLASQIAGLTASGHQVLLVSSGAVAAGREVLGDRYDPTFLPHRQAASAIGQSRIMTDGANNPSSLVRAPSNWPMAAAVLACPGPACCWWATATSPA